MSTTPKRSKMAPSQAAAERGSPHIVRERFLRRAASRIHKSRKRTTGGRTLRGSRQSRQFSSRNSCDCTLVYTLLAHVGKCKRRCLFWSRARASLLRQPFCDAGALSPRRAGRGAPALRSAAHRRCAAPAAGLVRLARHAVRRAKLPGSDGVVKPRATAPLYRALELLLLRDGRRVRAPLSTPRTPRPAGTRHPPIPPALAPPRHLLANARRFYLLIPPLPTFPTPHPDPPSPRRRAGGLTTPGSSAAPSSAWPCASCGTGAGCTRCRSASLGRAARGTADPSR